MKKPFVHVCCFSTTNLPTYLTLTLTPLPLCTMMRLIRRENNSSSSVVRMTAVSPIIPHEVTFLIGDRKEVEVSKFHISPRLNLV